MEYFIPLFKKKKKGLLYLRLGGGDGDLRRLGEGER